MNRLRYSDALTASKSSRPRAAVLGMFDGVHRGHQIFLSSFVKRAKSFSSNALPTVLTFDPHPMTVLRERVPFICSAEQQDMLFSKIGIEEVIEIPFTRAVSQLSAAEFIDRFLVTGLQVKFMGLGPDSTMGRDRSSPVQDLAKLFQERGIEQEIFPEETFQSEKISSRTIRDLIFRGEVAEALELLGHPFEYEGTVERGDRRGRELGFSTLNFYPERSHQILPASGVYATSVRLLKNETPYFAVTNVGVRPTFDGTRTVMETHILSESLDKPWYGERVLVSFFEFLRAEKKFESGADLREQIVKDCEAARRVHDRVKRVGSPVNS